MFSLSSPKPVSRSFKDTLQAAADELNIEKKGGGILFRTYYTNHLDLNRIADRKAHFMIAINVFLVSLVVTRKHMGVLSKAHYLLWPNLVMVACCVTSIVIAVLVTRPIVPKRPPPGDTRPVNWFFFGSFCHRPLEEFHENIHRLMGDEEALYKAMIRDLYYMGNSLAKKYRLLTRCYQFFYYGLSVTVLSYLAAFGWHYFF